MNRLLPLVQDLAGGLARALRAALWRSALIGVAGLLAGLAIGFLGLAAFLGLKTLMGPGLAALSMGAILLAMAAGVMVLASVLRPKTPKPAPVSSPQTKPSSPPSAPMKAASFCVFTAAFLLGRRLASQRGPSNPS